MSSVYRIVHYSTDPFVGSRVPIAALVRTGKEVRVARTPSLPGPRELGSDAAWMAIHLTLGALTNLDGLKLPPIAGPQVSLGQEIALPFDVHDPVRWVEEHVLASRQPNSPELVDQRYAPRRESRGMQFFTTWKVDRWVKRDFRLDQSNANPVSHYVAGATELLLMEPILGTRAQLGQDLRQVNMLFLAWEKILQNHQEARTARPIAYVLTEGNAAAVDEARERLAESRADVVNVDDLAARSAFLDRVRSMGRSGEPGAPPLH